MTDWSSRPYAAILIDAIVVKVSQHPAQCVDRDLRHLHREKVDMGLCETQRRWRHKLSCFVDVPR